MSCDAWVSEGSDISKAIERVLKTVAWETPILMRSVISLVNQSTWNVLESRYKRRWSEKRRGSSRDPL